MIMKTFRNLSDLVFPRLCGACDRYLAPWEDEICLLCLMEIPLSQAHLQADNPVAQVFWGRVRLEQASAWFVYHNGSRFGNLLHRLKYEDQPRIGQAMGRQYGYQLLHARTWEIPDLIIPVPLHPKRQRKRGYNQSEQIAIGLSQALQIPVGRKLLVRTRHTQTQTAKNRADRYLNVSGKFQVPHPEKIAGKHLLLIDDVITTGATIEACAEVLLQTEGTRVSVLGIGFAVKRG